MKVEKMRQERKKPTAIFMNFVALFKKFKSDLFCFFEGEDDIKYYSIRIKNITGLNSENIHYSSCDGKSVICKDGKFGVLEVYRIITAHKEYENTKLAFFIDRDFDSSIYQNGQEKLKNIYETPCYSIENFYTSSSAFQEIIKCEFKLEELEEDFHKVLSLYTLRQKDFHREIKLLNAWIVYQKKSSIHVKLSGYKASTFVDIYLDKILCKYDVEKLEKMFPQSLAVTEEAIEKIINEFDAQVYQKCFRGKFEADFLVNFLQKLIHQANQEQSPYFSKKLQVNLRLSRETMISDLCHYADNPPCLYKFLKSFTIDDK